MLRELNEEQKVQLKKLTEEKDSLEQELADLKVMRKDINKQMKKAKGPDGAKVQKQLQEKIGDINEDIKNATSDLEYVTEQVLDLSDDSEEESVADKNKKSKKKGSSKPQGWVNMTEKEMLQAQEAGILAGYDDVKGIGWIKK